ncbi:unnamed protein product [Cylicocyclus nassatus]|uniref:Uncharacterized protein n=1 Tax=Cylicocyclus nassatus TaxID=53992 RepID=A0AA36GSB5_CYLNA|nr:unnamed protein product [Cylicocyclus nassatus]
MSENDYCSCDDPREAPSAPRMESSDRFSFPHLLRQRPPAYAPPSHRKTLKIDCLFCIGVAQLLVAALLLYGGICCELYVEAAYCSYYSLLWMPALCLVNSLIGIVAVVINYDTLLFVHLCVSVMAVAAGAASTVISLFDYSAIGTTQWSSKNNLFCLLPTYDPPRDITDTLVTSGVNAIRKSLFILLGMQEIYKIGRHSNFSECIWQFKTGLLIVNLSIVGAIFLVVLSTISIVLCARRIKEWPKLR